MNMVCQECGFRAAQYECDECGLLLCRTCAPKIETVPLESGCLCNRCLALDDSARDLLDRQAAAMTESEY